MKVTTPAPVIGRVKDDIDRVFDRFFAAPFFGEPLYPVLPLERAGMAGVTWTPMLDLTEGPTEYLVRLEVPGIHRENLDLEFADNVPTITGRRDEVQEGAGETYLWREREAGKFVRKLRLPGVVDEAKIEAAYQNGILTLKLPKAVPAVANRILIK
jgi:HSP20 family protein